MGTEFWWFYDVLTLTIAAGLLYHAAAKGFNKLIFQLVGTVLAFAAGFFGSGWLAEPVYSGIFCENNITVIRAEHEITDINAAVLEQAQRLYPEQTAELTEQELEQSIIQAKEGGTYPDWMPSAVGAAAEQMMTDALSPKPEKNLQMFIAENPQLMADVLASSDTAAQVLEREYYRPYYLQVVRMVAFLLLETVVLILAGIISGMIGDPEQLMHIRKCNKLLAIPAGLIQVFCVLVTFAVAVRLIVIATDDMMLLFNQAAIDETKLFKLLYHII